MRRSFSQQPRAFVRDTRQSSKRQYVRERDLPGLIGLWPSEIAARSSAERQRLLAKLRRALRMERQRGVGGHWAYDLERHAQLLRAYRAEAVACAQMSLRRGGDPN